MVSAPRFENVEQDVQDGCFLTAGVSTSDTTWTVDDTSKLTGGRYFIGTPTSEERIQLLSVDSSTQINVTRGFEASTPGSWPSSASLKKLSPLSGFNSDVEWGCTISNIIVTEDGSLKVGGGSDRTEEADPRCKYTGSWEDYKYAGGFHGVREAQRCGARIVEFDAKGNMVRNRHHADEGSGDLLQSASHDLESGLPQRSILFPSFWSGCSRSIQGA